MKNVLFILDYYLPNASANGICVSKVVEEFINKEMNISLLCFHDKARKQNPIHCEKCNREFIYEIARPHSNYRFRKIKYYLKWIFQKKQLPSENTDTVHAMLEKAEEIITQKQIDTVICTHLPVESITVGVKLKEKFPSLHLVAYMLDSLSGGILPRLLPTSFCRNKKIAWDNKMLSHFDQIVLMESSREHHATYTANANWFKNAHFLDVPALYNNNSFKAENPQKKEITIVFVGTMGQGIRTPYALLKVLSYIKNVSIRFVVAGRSTCENLLESLAPNCSVKLDILGELPYQRAQDILNDADFLVNLGNVNPNLVPSKIFEYMSCGKPIISTYTSDMDSSIPYLKQYPSVFLIDERKTDFDEIAKQLSKFITENQNNNIPYENIEQCFYKNTAVAFYNLLSSSNIEK